MPDVAHIERTRAATPDKLPKGLDALAHSLVGKFGGVSLRSLRREAEEIQADSNKWREAKDGTLAEEMRRLRAIFRRRGRESTQLEGSALALCVEAARRKIGLSAHTEQIMGALAIRKGLLAEMATGEGKTLTIALAAVAPGWSGRPVHVITANDYLAGRDAKSFKSYYQLCGIEVGHVSGEMPPADRRERYEAEVVYTTAKELVADFLRDRLQLGTLVEPGRRLIRTMLQPGRALSQRIVMRGLHTAIVDEADHAMIDEAVTPLIISRQVPNAPLVEASRTAYEIAAQFVPGDHYRIDRRYKEVELTKAAKEKIAAAVSGLPGIWQGQARGNDLVRQALQAREFFHRDEQYVISDGKLIIVDESTGRLMPQRTWSEGLHQAIEAKEGLEISSPAETLSRLSFQRFFRLFYHLSGLTGTATEAAKEFWHIYQLPVVSIPHHRPCIRREPLDRIFATADAKWSAVTEEIVTRHARGQPVLVGTRSVEASEHLAGLLRARGLNFSVLNATRHAEEGAIVARAGHRGKITIATNMAGRGTDIRLGAGVADLGGLHVLATERHESRRIDRQLAGRSARQGDPGSAQSFVSLEDDLVRRHLPGAIRQRVRGLLAAGLPGANKLGAAAVRFAQKSSQRLAFQQRRSVLRNDSKLDESLGFTAEG